ncbi:MAG: ParB/RepB/Spo0J family partition protein [Bacteroidetes bacterium]|nr:ParB/RepB/Spo0J family partition protein [Crocinitomicaceae bacterium]MCC5926105.1 ParB/RepB/Spo0J family partition protein [Bacteroidota bacterium]MCH8523040.1 ParB/RepB/Spo0J family partition protein [Balneolales bacterium]
MAKKVLGRGLGAYFQDVEGKTEKEPAVATEDVLQKMDSREKVNVILHVPVASIRANPFQPRKDFDEIKLQELADSIRELGLIQPITVRHIGEERYELISGERRLRASRMSGIDHIPAYIRDVNDDEIIAMALVENIQREQLNPIETALGYQRLLEECDLTQEDVAKRVGKNRTTVTNMLRLLNLPAFLQAALKQNRISIGHARALISVENERIQSQLLDKIIENDMSVRQVEEAVKSLANRKKGGGKALTKKDQKDIEMIQLAASLQNRLSTRVHIKRKSQGGEIKIEYYSDEELDRLLNLFDSLS